MTQANIDFDADERNRNKKLRRLILDALQLTRANSPSGGISGSKLIDLAQSTLPEDRAFDDDAHALQLIIDLKNRAYVEFVADDLRRGERFSLRHLRLVKITAKGSDLVDGHIAIDPTGASTAGDLTWSAPVPVGVRCLLDEPMRGQVIALGARIAEATAVLYVEKTGLAIEPKDKQRMAVLIDRGTSQTYEVIFVRNSQKDGGLSHFECFLKVM